MPTRSQALRLVLACTLATAPLAAAPVTLSAQTSPSGNVTQVGTVKSVTPAAIAITTDAKAEIGILPATNVRVMELAPGSTDPKTAQPAALTDIAPGDRILAIGKPGETPGTQSAVRIYLMKSGALATLHASQSADWQKRGTGGLVKTVSGSTLTVTNGAKLLTVNTTPSTVYRRYAGDSVQFEDAKPSTLEAIHPGDQLRVRGDKSADGGVITADEIVSGSFENLAGLLSKVDAASGTITLKDLATKKEVTVRVTANSNLRHLPATAAAAFARTHAGANSTGSAPPSTAAADSAAAGGAAQGRRAGMDLSQLLSRLPAQPLTELKPGDAVLIVASETPEGVVAVTMLSGVEAILSASPGAAAPTLSPWNIGTGEMEGAGGGGGAPGGGAGR